MSLSFLDHFSQLEDPRVVGLVTYPLSEILLCALVGVLCGGEDWEDVVLICEHKLDFLRGFLNFESGIASTDTFQRVFDLLDAKVFAESFASWIGSILGHVEGVVAIDGKTICGAKQANGRGLHVLSAYAHEAGLVIGQRRVDQKSNEITAIPDLLHDLAIKGALVTIDAMGTQKDIARAIIEKKCDYVLALKGNQGVLHKDVRLWFEAPDTALNGTVFTTLDAGHGRIEERSCRATDEIGWLIEAHPDWKGLRSIAVVTASRRNKATGQASEEKRFYISSLPAEPEKILAATRAHWSIENNLHWMLDVILREDICRTHKDHAALNLATIRKMVLAICRKNTDKIAIKRKIKKAALSNSFLEKLLR